MAQRSDGADGRPCILVVENDRAVRRSLQLLLRSRGYDVRAYPSSRAALADGKALTAVCLVADLMMPDIDGIELLISLRQNGWDRHAVLISGHLTPNSRDRAAAAGYAAVLDKPVADSRLTDVVGALLNPAG